MRDVIGQDDLEDAEPSPSAGRRAAGWPAAAALLVTAVAVLGTGGVGGDRDPDGGRGAAQGSGVADPGRETTQGSGGSAGDDAGAPRGGGVPAGRGADVRGAPGSRSSADGTVGGGHGGLARPVPPVPADSALRASLAARPLGGRTVTTGLGARGDVRLEIRNGGAPLRLWGLTAEVPGVRFSRVVGPHGLPLTQDERVELVLAFRIDDCERVRRTGRLVLLVERAGVEREVGLTVTHDREAGTVRQVALDRVLGACPD